MSTLMTALGKILTFKEELPGGTGSYLPILVERRSKSRYPMDLSVRFRFGFTGFLSGQGRTVNLSAGGLLVASRDVVLHDEITTGALLEISIEWPALLDGRIPLQLFAVGRVVRRGAIDFAATFDRYEFRTMRSLSLPRARLGVDVVPCPHGKLPVSNWPADRGNQANLNRRPPRGAPAQS